MEDKKEKMIIGVDLASGKDYTTILMTPEYLKANYVKIDDIEVDEEKVKKIMNKVLETPVELTQVLSKDFDDVERLAKAIAQNIKDIVRAK